MVDLDAVCREIEECIGDAYYDERRCDTDCREAYDDGLRTALEIVRNAMVQAQIVADA